VQSLNEKVFYFLNNLNGLSPWSDYVFYWLAEWLGWVLVFVLPIYLLLAKDKRRALVLVLLSFFSAVIAWYLASFLKYSLGSPRPFVALPDLRPLFMKGGLDAFPSGHSVFFSALALPVFYFNKKLGVVFLLGAFLIGLSRIIAGVHWPSDVLAGWGIGFVVSMILLLVARNFVKNLPS